MTIEVTFDSRQTNPATRRTRTNNEQNNTTTTPSSTDTETLSHSIHVLRPLTVDSLRTICRQADDHYETMELNDSLRLSYANIDILYDDSIEDNSSLLAQCFPSLKALHADHNQLDQQCFLHIPYSIQSLYLDHNAIHSLDTIPTTFSLSINLSNIPSLSLSLTYFPHLTTLDVSHNPIRSLRGLSGLTQLVSITANHCELSDSSELKALRKLRDIDLSFNQLPDMEAVITSLISCEQSIRVVHLSGNPGINRFPQYRRSLLSRLPHVRFMDGRPVNDDERAAVKAWAIGGHEAEKKFRMDNLEEKRRKQEAQFEAWTEWKSKQIADRQPKKHETASLSNNSNSPSNTEKRVQYQSVLNEDLLRYTQKHEQHTTVLPPPVHSHSITPPDAGEFNVLTSSSADSYLQSVLSSLPSLSQFDSSDSEEEERESVPFLVGLSEQDDRSESRSALSFNQSARATIAALLQSSPTPTIAFPVLFTPRTSISPEPTSYNPFDKRYEDDTSHHSNHDIDFNQSDDEQKECDYEPTSCIRRWDNTPVQSILSAEPLHRSSHRRTVISETESDDESGWTNDLSDAN